MRTRRLALPVAVVLPLVVEMLVSAGGLAGCAKPEASATPTPNGSPRSFALASTGVQAEPSAAQFFAMNAANLADDVDVVSVHQDFYGVPWDEFEANAAPPAEWVAIMDQIKQTYAGRRIFLTLQLAGGTQRQYLADKATVDMSGNVHAQGNWGPQCYDFATATDGSAMKLAWSRYVTWMVNEFDPEWVNVGAELNMFAQCTSAWPGMVEAERAGYDAAKAAKPSVIAFPSIQLDVLYGRQLCPGGVGTCYDANYAQLADLKRDRFAISTYPMGDPVWRSPAEVDADYLTRAADRGGEKLVVAETGWSSVEMDGMLNGTCTPAYDYTEADEDAWMARIFAAADAEQSDLVTWWSNRDFIPASVSNTCTYDSTWQPIVDLFRSLGGSDPTMQYIEEIQLKFFGTMGIRDYAGNPKGAPYTRWKATQSRPLQ